MERGERSGNDVLLLLEKCGDRSKYVCEFPNMLNWLEKHDIPYCIDMLSKRFVYAQIAGSIITKMKTFKQPPVTVLEMIPEDYHSSGTLITYRQHAPFRGRESGGLQKCPNCGADAETLIVRSQTRVYHKCRECCALIETADGSPFL